MLAVVSTPAAAHSPYFSRAVEVTLPNGQRGEMRLIHGDGIFFADPVRILVLNSEGRLLARSHRSVPISLICDDGHCRGYDHARMAVLDLDPTSFRHDGPLVPSVSQHNRGKLWELEDGAAWGFAVRSARPNEVLHGEWAHLSEHPGSVGILLILGLLMGGLAFVNPRRPSRVGAWGMALRVVWPMLRVLGFMLVAVVSGYWMALVGISPLLWLAVSFGGLMLALLLRRFVRHQTVGELQPLQ